MMEKVHYNLIDTSVASQRSGLTKRRIRQMCAFGKIPAKIIKRKYYLDANCDKRFMGVKTAGQLTAPDDLARVPAHKRDQALQRLGLIRAAEKFIAEHMAAGNTRTQSVKVYAETQGVGARSLHRWMGRYRAEGLLGLVDTRGGGANNESISPDAWEHFKSFYLDQKRWSVKLCLQMVRHIKQTQDRNWRIPSLRVMQNLAAGIPKPVCVLHRQGQAAYDAQCAPYIQVDPDSVAAGAVWVGDHHQYNCWIRHRNKWIRPWITAWQDMRSRKIVGHDTNAGPNQTTIMLASRRGMEKFGPPEAVKIDNGRDYDSECWTGTTKARRRSLVKGYIDEKLTAGIYGLLDISVSFAIPYHPQAKPIERFFDTLDRQFTKTIPTYCGKGVSQRPEGLEAMLKSDKAIAAAYDLESFARLAGKYIEDIYNVQPHTGVGMEGRSPAEVFSQRPSRRVLKDGVLDLLMRVWSGELTISKNGVRFKNLCYGQYDGELLSRQGQKVRLSYDPDDLSSVFVYAASTMQLICVASQARLVAYGQVAEDSLREGMRQKARARRAHKEYVDTRLAASMDLPALAIKAQAARQETPEIEESTAAAIRAVPTIMDDQVADHRRLLDKKILRKAAGAENRALLDFDIESLRKKRDYNLDI